MDDFFTPCFWVKSLKTTRQVKSNSSLFETLTKPGEMKGYFQWRNLIVSTMMISFFIVVGFGQTSINGSNIPYEVDFSSEIASANFTNCAGASSAAFNEDGGDFLIQNIDGSACDISCGSVDGSSVVDNLATTVDFDISCLSDVSVNWDFEWSGGLQQIGLCEPGGTLNSACWADLLEIGYDLDGGGATEQPNICGDGSDSYSFTGLNGSILSMSILGRTIAANEYIRITKLEVDGIALSGNEDCSGALAINDGENGDNTCDMVDGIVWYEYTMNESGSVTIQVSDNGGGVSDPQIVAIITDCSQTESDVNLPDNLGLETCIDIDAGSSVFIAVGDPTVTEFGTFQINITETPSPTPDLTQGTDISIDEMGSNNGTNDFEVCVNDAFDLTAADPNDTNSDFIYDWMDVGGATYSGATIMIGAAIDADHNGTWMLTVTDINGCSAESTFDVLVNPAPTPIVPDIVAACENGDLILEYNGSETIEDWIHPNGLSLGNLPVVTVSTNAQLGTDEGLFVVVVSDGNGCTGTNEVNVALSAGPTVVITSLPDPIEICPSETVTLDETGGDGDMWMWTTDGTGSFDDDSAQSTDVSGLSDGEIITVTVTDINGCTSSSSVTATVFAAPSNDDCTAAETASTGTTSGTTDCASPDSGLCSDTDHVVYYTYTVAGPGAQTVDISVAGTGATDPVVDAWTDCGGGSYDSGVSCGASIQLLCVPEGTVLTIPVGTADGNDGTFDLEIMETGSAVANNDCSGAENIDITVACDPVTTNGDTSGACPEGFSSGCNQENDPTIWYTVTTLAGTTDMEFTNVTGELQVFEDDCPVATPISPCITGDQGVPVAASTTYLISVTVPGGEGAISFDLALLAAPANDNCGSAIDASSGSESGTNGCASADGNLCSENDHVVYYTYTVAGPGAAQVDITVAGTNGGSMVVDAWTDCSGALYDASVSCGASITLNCVPEGTNLTIPVGSSTGSEGEFDLTITETLGSVPNDDCSGAENISISVPCDPVSVSGDTSGACPEGFSSGCNQENDPTIWYTVTTLGGTTDMEFTNVVGEMQVFEDDCPVATAISACITGDIGVTVSASTTYLISATLPGGEGAIGFDLALLEAPANDNCGAAIDASSGSESGNNGCASADGNLCSDNDHVVYYTYTVAGPGVVQVDITVAATSGGSMVVGAWTDCTGAQYDAAVSCGATMTLTCVPPGTVLTIPVGSSTGSEGDFDLTISETAGTVTNDDCSGAEGIAISIPCDPVSVSGDTSGACPEGFSSGCNQENDPTIWYTVTTLGGTTDIEFTNVVGEMQVFEDDCPIATPISACITGDIGVTVSASTTYLISATLPGGEGAIGFDLALLEAPANDNCGAAIDASSGSESGNNGCASADGNLCSDNDHVVYYTYTVAGPGVVQVDITVAATSGGAMVVGAWTDCSGAQYDAGVSCGATMTLTCVPPGTVLTIPVGSSTGSEGDFDLTISETAGSVANDDCSGAEDIAISIPCDPVSVSGDTSGACPEGFDSGCNQQNDPTIWYTVTTLGGTTDIEFTNVVGEVQVFEDDCPIATSISGCVTGDIGVPVSSSTTYLISATLPGGEGAIGFDIALLEAPGNDNCGSALDAAGGASGSNACASADGNLCSDNDHVVYYTYTVVGPGVVQVDISVTGTNGGMMVVDAWEDCGGTPYDDAIGCSSSIMVPCVPEGTVLTIPVGSTTGMEGDFDLAISETGGTVPNDDCSGAEVLTIDEVCEPFSFTGDTTGACPENITGNGCTQDEDPTVWFEFTVIGAATIAEFTNVTGGVSLEVVSNECPLGGNTIVGPCFSGDEQVPVTAGTTYFVTATIAGGEGAFGFDLALLEAPANDICTTAELLSNDATVVGNNGCASSDILCGDTDHVVFYTYTVAGPGTANLDITVMGLTTDGINFAAWSDCGGTIIQGQEACSDDAGGTLELTCLPEGTVIFIPVGSGDGNTGDFEITVSESGAGSGPANDLCDNAEAITALECIPTIFDGSTTDACPEIFMGCGVEEDPTVWHELSFPAGTVSVDFTDLTNGVNLGLWDACNGTLIECLTGDMTDMTGLPNPVYVSAVIPGGEGSYSFTVTAKIPPANDQCPNAQDGGGTGTTCCASTDGVGCEWDNSVWYSYTQTDPNAGVIVMVSAGTISGQGVDVFTGDCSGLTPVPDGQCIISQTVEIPVSCIDGATIYVQVSSVDESSCGTHTVTFTEVPACDSGAECGSAGDNGMAPITNGGPVCVGACNLFICNMDCGPNTVWFEITTDDQASILNLQVDADFDPFVCVFADNCGGDMIYSGAGDVANVAVVANFTYLVGVSIGSGDAGDVEVCAQTFLQLVDCAVSADIEPTRPEYPDSPPEGPYCPGETVTFCYDITFNIDPAGDPDGNNCQWLQGIVPVIGGGWDDDLNSIESQPPGGWSWFDEGEVDYNVSNPILSLTTECDGDLGLEYGGGGLGAGDGLPGGFWFTSPGGSGCANDGDPDTMWGLPGGCGGSQSVSFCFDLTVRNVSDPSECDDPCNSDLKVHIFTFADGETGCWSSAVCAGDIPVTFDAFMDCSSLVTVELIEGDLEICSGESPGLKVEAIDGASTIILESDGNPNIIGASLNGAFPGGLACLPDVLINPGTEPEMIIYEFFAQSPNPDSDCNGPRIFVEVIVYPDIDIEFDEPYDVCFDGQVEIIPTINGGSGIITDYEWSTGHTGPSIMAPEVIGDPPGPYSYSLIVTDDQGCTGEASVEYIIRPEVVLSASQTSDFACIDGEFADEEICISIASGQNNGPFTYNWIYDNASLDVDEDDQCIIINEEFSDPGFYEFMVEVADQYGCVYFIEGIFFSVENGPEIDYTFPTCLYDGGDEIEYSFEVCNINGGAADWYLYDEFFSFQLQGPQAGDCATFFVVPFSVGDDFPITFGIEAVDLATGCIAYETIEIFPPVIPDMPDFITGCIGQEITLTIDNDDDFEDINWCTGDNGPSTVLVLEEDDFCAVTVFDDSGCEITYEIEIDVTGEVDAEISGSTSICAGGSTTLSAPDNPGWTYEWSTTETTSSIVVNAAGTYTVMVTNGDCEATDEITVVVAAELEPLINGGDFCEGDSANLSTGDSFETYQWSDAAGNPIGAGANPWEIDVTVAGTYIVSVTDSGCSGTGEIVVAQSTAATGTVLPAIVCNSNVAGDPTTINLEDFVTGTNGTVSYLDNLGIPVAAPYIVDFDGDPAATLDYTVIVEAADPCMDLELTLTIEVIECGCPNPAINNIGDYCNDAGITLDLENFTTPLTDPGSFSVLDAAGNLAAVQPVGGMLLIDQDFDAGVYTLVYTLTATSTGCPENDMEVFEIFAAPNLMVVEDQENICNSDEAGDDTVVDLTDNVVYAGTGQWNDAAGNMVPDPSAIDFNGLPPGPVNFFYTTSDATGLCNNTTVQVTINVIDCNCPTIGIDPLPGPLCVTSTPVNLNDFLIADTEPGTWTAMGPDPTYSIGAAGVFDPDGLPEGTYTFTYTLTIPGSITCTNEVSGTIELFEAPILPILSDTSLCGSTTNPIYPTNIDLTGLTPLGFTGTWSAPSDYNGGVIPDPTNVQFLDTLPGSFIFTFTTDNAVAPCDNDMVNLIINIRDCDCPIINLFSPTTACNDGSDSVIDLEDLQLVPTPPLGTWTYDGGPETNVTINGTEFDATGVIPGDYMFTYTIADPIAGCDDFAQAVINITEPIVFDFVPSLTACSLVSTQGDSFIDFEAISTGVTGSWDVSTNYPDAITDYSNVSFLDLPVGESYTFTFTGASNGECAANTDEIIVTVIDCDCPNINIDGAPELCNDSDSFDLDELLSAGIVDGTISVEDADGNDVSPGSNMFNATGISEGIYTVIFTPATPPPADCPQQDTVFITVVAPPSAGLPSSSTFCEEDSETVILADLLDGETPGGDWQETSGTSSIGIAFDPDAGTFEITGQAPGEYTFEYFFDTSNSPCDPVSETVVIEIEATPNADAGAGGTIDCDFLPVTLGGTGTSTGSQFEYVWLNPAGDTIYQGPDLDFVTQEGGDWTLIVLNTLTGCTESDVTTVVIDNDVPNYLFEVTDSPCFGDNAGMIEVTDIIGGTPPFFFSLNGGELTENLIFGNLGPGDYELVMTDGLDCSRQYSMIVVEPGPITFDVGSDLTVEVGETVELGISILDPTIIETATWTQDGEVICTGPPEQCLTFEVEPPLVPTLYCLEIVTADGCVETECRELQSLDVRDIYIPNIISNWEQEGDENSTFYVHTDAFVESIPRFSIYDRWGELIFSFEDGLPNDPTWGWDGNFNGQRVAQGVYVYLIELAYAGGETEIFTGTVTVTR